MYKLSYNLKQTRPPRGFAPVLFSLVAPLHVTVLTIVLRQTATLAFHTPKFEKCILPTFLKRFMSEVVRIGSIIIFHLSQVWKAKFFILCDVIFLVRLQEKFEIYHSWPKGLICVEVAARRPSPLYSRNNVLMPTMPIALSMAHPPWRGMATSLRKPRTGPQRSPVLGRARRPTKESTWALQQVACFALKCLTLNLVAAQRTNQQFA